MPTAADPQGLNRYSYCNNNPLNSTDPSGHDPLTVAIIMIVVAVVVNVAVAAATGGDIGKAALAGFIGGLVGVVGGFIASIALSTVAATLGPVATGAIVGAVGGAAGGAASAAVSGGDVGMGALTGAVGGAIGGAAGGWTKDWGNSWRDLAARGAVAVCSGALAGGVTAAIAGGNIWQGMAMGAAGAAIAFAATVAMSGKGDEVAEEVKEDHAVVANAGTGSQAASDGDSIQPSGTRSNPIQIGDQEITAELQKIRQRLADANVRSMSSDQYSDFMAGGKMDTIFHLREGSYFTYSGKEYPTLIGRIFQGRELNYIGVGEGFAARGFTQARMALYITGWKYRMYNEFPPSMNTFRAANVGFYWYKRNGP